MGSFRVGVKRTVDDEGGDAEDEDDGESVGDAEDEDDAVETVGDAVSDALEDDAVGTVGGV